MTAIVNRRSNMRLKQEKLYRPAPIVAKESMVWSLCYADAKRELELCADYLGLSSSKSH